jgi:hypothetical protein
MRSEDVLRELAGTISGVRILETAADIARFHRVPGSPGYDDAADVVCRRLAEADVAVTVHDYPADGRTKTYEWVSPPAWSVRVGTLIQTAPTQRKLIDFAEVAQGVVVHSPGGTFEGELVHLGAPTGDADYDAVDLVGKVVLACARAGDVVPRAAKRGAIGVIVYPDQERAAVSHDLVQYHSIFPAADDIAHLVPAFSVSRRVGDRLVKELGAGPVTLRGEVDAEFADGALRVLEARIEGRDARLGEVLFMAHLCHPRGSANDNASGSAVLVELARGLQASRDALGLRMGFRFLWMPEFYGSLPWAAAHAAELRSVEVALNLDMVGASPDRIGEPLRIFRAANHTPHIVNALVEPLLSRIAASRATESPRGSSRPLHGLLDRPSGGSDHLVFAASPHRLPALMLGHDDPYWHTDFDTVDKLDPTRLKQAAILAGALAALAGASSDEAERVGGWLLAYSVRELTRAADLARDLEPTLGVRLLDLALDVEVARANTLAPISAARRGALVDVLERTRRALGPAPAGSRTSAVGGEEERPARRIDGPLVYSITERFTDEERVFFKDRLGANHRALAEGLLNQCDGTKTAVDIALLLSLDAGVIVPVDDVHQGVALYRKAGYVT